MAQDKKNKQLVVPAEIVPPQSVSMLGSPGSPGSEGAPSGTASKDILITPGYGNTINQISQMDFKFIKHATTDLAEPQDTEVKVTLYPYGERLSGDGFDSPVLVIGGTWNNTRHAPHADYIAGASSQVAQIWIHPRTGKIEATEFNAGAGGYNGVVLAQVATGFTITGGFFTSSTFSVVAGNLTLTSNGSNPNLTIPATATATAVVNTSTFTQYGVVFSSSATNGIVASTGQGASGQPLVGAGAANPVFGNVNIGSFATGTLAITNGGTGLNSAPTLGQLLIGNNASGYTKNQIAVTSPITIAHNATSGQPTIAINASSANTNNFVVQRDGSGNFSAGAITASSIALTTGTISTSPANATDIVNKSYVDAMSAGIDVRGSCRLATTTTLPAHSFAANAITADADGLLTIDGVAVNEGDRVLIKDEASSHLEHGIYSVDSDGDGKPFLLVRTEDADVSSEVTAGMFTFIEEGTVNADTGWVLITNNPITLNTTALEFAQFTGAADITAGLGLNESLNTIAANVSLDNAQASNQIRIQGGSGANNSSSTGDAGTTVTFDLKTNGSGSMLFEGKADGFELTAGATGRKLTLISGNLTLTSGNNNPNLTIPNTATATAVVNTSAFTQYGIVFSSSATNGIVASTGQGASGQPLVGAGASNPVFGNVNVGSYATGTLAIGNGGTGVASTPTLGQVLFGNNSSGFTLNQIAVTSPITIAHNATSGQPTVAINASSANTNNFVVQRDGSGNFSAGTITASSIALTTGTISTAPSSSTDIANKLYVDSVASNADVKVSCRLATDAALAPHSFGTNAITASGNGALSIDGVTVAVNDRILVKDEGGGSHLENGIYTVTATGDASNPFVLTRATDADSSAEVTAGIFTFIEEGTANASTGWMLTTNNPITLNTTALTFGQFSSATLVAGIGVNKTGSTLAANINLDNAQAANQIRFQGGSGANDSASAGNAGTSVTFDIKTTGSGSLLFEGKADGFELTAGATGRKLTVISGNVTLTSGNNNPNITVPNTATATAVVNTSSFTQYGIVFSSSATNGITASTSQGAVGQPLVGAAAANPGFGNVDISQYATGVLPIANGGTNSNAAQLTITAGRVVYTDGTRLISLAVPTSSANGVLYFGTAPTWTGTTTTVGLTFQSQASGVPQWANLVAGGAISAGNGISITSAAPAAVSLNEAYNGPTWTGAHIWRGAGVQLQAQDSADSNVAKFRIDLASGQQSIVLGKEITSASALQPFPITWPMNSPALLTITAKRVVKLNTVAGEVVHTGASENDLACGVAVVGGATGATVRIARSGRVTVNADTVAVSVGDYLVTAASGQVTSSGATRPTSGGWVGRALTAKAGGSAGDVDMLLDIAGGSIGTVGGTGTQFTLPMWSNSGGTVLGNSMITQNSGGSECYVGADSASDKLVIGGSTASSSLTINANGQTTAAFGIAFGTDANLVNLYRNANDTLRTDDNFIVSSSMAIGTTIDSNRTLMVLRTITSGSQNALKAQANITATNASFPVGIQGVIDVNASTGTINYVAGGNFTASTQSGQSGAISELWGLDMSATHAGSANIATMAGQKLFTNLTATSSGTVTAYTGQHANLVISGSSSANVTDWRGTRYALAHDGSGTVTRLQMLDLENPTGTGVITTLYGIRIRDLTRGTTNFGIYFDGTSGLARQGINWNGDTNLYRGAADLLKTDDKFQSMNRFLLGLDMSFIPVASGQSVLTSWHALQLKGNFRSTVDHSPSNVAGINDASVIIPNQLNTAIGLIIFGATSQSGNLQEWRDVSASTYLSAIDAAGNVVFHGNITKTISMNRHTTSDTAGTNLTVTAGGSTSGATNKAGGHLVLRAGQNTGSGVSKLQFYTPAAGGTSTTDGTQTLRAEFDQEGLNMQSHLKHSRTSVQQSGTNTTITLTLASSNVQLFECTANSVTITVLLPASPTWGNWFDVANLSDEAGTARTVVVKNAANTQVIATLNPRQLCSIFVGRVGASGSTFGWGVPDVFTLPTAYS